MVTEHLPSPIKIRPQTASEFKILSSTRPDGILARHSPKRPINTNQTRISNRFPAGRNENHKEKRYGTANFNKFLDAARWKILLYA
jgi:hypothetical protein